VRQQIKISFFTSRWQRIKQSRSENLIQTREVQEFRLQPEGEQVSDDVFFLSSRMMVKIMSNNYSSVQGLVEKNLF
jgi:hypothetical protein